MLRMKDEVNRNIYQVICLLYHLLLHLYNLDFSESAISLSVVYTDTLFFIQISYN